MYVQDAFPAKLTKKGAITNDAKDALIHDAITTSNFTAVARKFREASHSLLYQCQEEYLRLVQHQKQKWENSIHGSSQPFDLSGADVNCEAAKKLFTYNPSPNWLEDIFLECVEEPIEFITRFQASITGQFLAADHTFKTAKYIRHSDKSRCYEAIWTVMNEYCQVAGQYMTQTKSWFEVAKAMELLWKRHGQVADLKGIDWAEVVSGCCGVIDIQPALSGEHAVTVYNLMYRVIMSAVVQKA